MKIPKALKNIKKEEIIPEKIQNIPLFFLSLFDRLPKDKVHDCRRLLYYPGAFIGIYLILLIFARDIETYLTFPALYANQQLVAGMKAPSLPWEVFTVKVGNTQISGTFIDNKAQKTIFYFHGNGLPLSYFGYDLNFFKELGYNVMSYDYPGYGFSSWNPTEKEVYETSIAFYETVKAKKNLQDENIIAIGHSIGAAPAIEFASSQQIGWLVLLAPFTSRYELAKDSYGWVPQRLFFLPDSFVNKRLIPYISAPILYIHGNEDTVIPISESKHLYRLSPDNSYYIELDNQGHNDILVNHKNLFSQALKTFIESKSLQNRYYFIDEKNEELLESPVVAEKNTQTWGKSEISTSIFTPKNAILPEVKAQVETPLIRAELPEWYVNPYDLDSDVSLTKYVNPSVSFNNQGYVPTWLVEVNSQYVYSNKGSAYLRAEAESALEELGKKFYEDFGTKLGVASAYRSYTYQKWIKDGGCSDSLCAKAGYSEHQSGLAVDLFEASTENDFLKKTNLRNYYGWMQQNAYKYGFENTYRKWAKIDGYVKEPWHWRYVGVGLATFLHNNNMTLAEYYYAVKAQK